MFIHKTDFAEDHRHATVEEARDCEYVAASEAAWDDVPCCSICDGAGHGYPGGGPCPLEVNERARWEDDQDEMRAAALGLSFADYAFA